MRQYRGLTKDGKWVYGWYQEFDGDSYIREGNILYCVTPETVGQDIGLEDKNKVEIYEGDIVEFDIVNMIWDEDKHEVKEHRPETWRRVIEWKAPKFIKHWYPEKMKVIGNIYQHSDLLKEVL